MKKKGGRGWRVERMDFEFRHWWSFSTAAWLISITGESYDHFTWTFATKCYSQAMWYKAAKHSHCSQKPPSLKGWEAWTSCVARDWAWGPFHPYNSTIYLESAQRSLVSTRRMRFVRNMNENRGSNWLFLNKEWNQHFQDICWCTISLSTV